ncbi:MAG TPA: NADPH:quinone reductase [Longimicrobiaceae bacterium]|nr:NADPH:quinone reductase [Longimicrobiaceae bacterium]
MKAIRVAETGGPGVMRVEEVPDPRPGPGELLLRVHAAGVNPVDAYKRSGRYGTLPELPYTPGSDAAGVVAAAGEGVTRFRAGDRVYTDHRATGAYAEYLVCASDHAHPLPGSASFAEGAALGVPYATAYRALFLRGGARAAESVLVHGATGGVGTAAVQLARATGLVVVGTGGSEEGRQEVLRQGAQHVLDHHEPGYLDRLMELTDGRGVDLILEMLANVNLGRDLGVLAKRGRVVVVGSRGAVEIDARNLMGRDADVRGITLFNDTPEEIRETHAALFAGLENGTVRPVIAEEFPLAEAPRAHEAVMGGEHKGKVVLTM